MGRIFGRPAVPPVLATSTALSMTDSVNVLPADPPASSVAPPPTRMMRPDDGAVAELRPVYFVAAPGAKVSGAPVPLVAVLPQTWLKSETEMRRAHQSTSPSLASSRRSKGTRWASIVLDDLTPTTCPSSLTRMLSE